MKAYRVSLTFVTACVLLIVSPFLTARGTAGAPVAANDLSIAARGVLVRAHNPSTSAGASRNLSPLTLGELARARRATAKYHDVANALADGYVDADLYTSGEGYHYINPSLVDGHFDLEQPEVLLYAARPGEDGLKLVAVEYVSPDTFPVGQRLRRFAINRHRRREQRHRRAEPCRTEESAAHADDRQFGLLPQPDVELALRVARERSIRQHGGPVVSAAGGADALVPALNGR